MSMNLSQFLSDFFKSGDTVRVSANELQALVRRCRELERENKRLKEAVEMLKIQSDALRRLSEEVPYVPLDEVV